MSTIDLSRQASDFEQRYAGVRMQQGRVLTDDDFNEAARLDAEGMRRIRLDAIGPYGSTDNGFLPCNVRFENDYPTFDLQAGTLELGGLRLEMSMDEPFHQQKDWLTFDRTENHLRPPGAGKSRVDLVWIEAWQQPVTAVEDRELFEVALGGPDTTTRIRTMRRVRVMPNVGSLICEDAWQTACAAWSQAHDGAVASDNEFAVESRLTVTFTEESFRDNLCSPDVAGGYLGAENQAIRVQAVSPTHYTWGFDNAAPLYRAVLMSEGADGAKTKLYLLTPPKDAVHWPLRDQVVEILPWGAALANGERVAESAGHLTKVASSYNHETQTLTITDAPPTWFETRWEERSDVAGFYHATVENGIDQERFVYLRVWNRGEDTASPAAIPITSGAIGRTGLSVSFTEAPPRSGDYWIIAARPAAPDVVTPWSFSKAGSPPHGVKRYRAPLALIQWLPDGSTIIHDCRPRFRPLTELRCCIDLVAKPGPGWERVFELIPPGGDAMICFPAGQYPLNATVVVANKGRLRLSGAGPGSRIHGDSLANLLLFQNCDGVDIRDLYFFGGNPPADGLNGTISFQDTRHVALSRLALRCKGGRERRVACLRVANSAGSRFARSCRVSLNDCDIYVGHLQTGLLLLNVHQVHLRDNRIVPAGTTVESVRKALASARFRDNLAQSALVLFKAGEPSLSDDYRLKINVKDKGVVQCWTDTALKKYLEESNDRDTRISSFRATQGDQRGQEGFLRIRIMRRLRRLLGSATARNANPRLGEWLDAIDSAARAVIGQGVVVAGRQADQVTIESTTIGNAVQGIHVGVSHASTNRSAPGADRTGRVVIRQNTVHTLLCAGSPLERHGIFVGNATSVTIADNVLSLERPAGLRHLPVDGIRVFGFLGEMVNIQGNHITGYSTSLRRVQRGKEPQNAVRVERDNYYDGAVILLA